MDVKISSTVENDHLLIVAQGTITNSEEHQHLTRQFYNEIMKSRSEKIIVDLSRMKFPVSIEVHDDIVNFYSEGLPTDIKSWKIAVVDESSYGILGKYWEYNANKKGYGNFKVFFSMADALAFIDE